jgi:hypothetical protein
VIAVEVTVFDVVAGLVFWAAVLVALWRWPGVLFGIGVAVGLWTVAPWASWLGLAVVGAAAGVWRVWGRGDRPTWQGVRWLVRRLSLAVMVVSAGVAALAPEPVAPVAFAILVVSALHVAGSWPPVEAPAGGERRLAVGAGERPGLAAGYPAGGGRIAERSTHVTAAGPCARCDGVLVAMVRLPADPTPEDLAGLVAHAACPQCGARLVGLVDAANPRAGLVWFEMPPPDERVEGIA